MKPIYDFFKNATEEMESHYERKREYINAHPELKANVWSELEGFVDYEKPLVMSSLVPHDEDYKKIEESGKFLLNPQTEFYGTKWDFSIEEANVVNLTEDVITLSPSTAWSPPTQFCERLTAKYKGVSVELSYDEGGCCFCGSEEFYEGEMIGQEFYSDSNYEEGLYKLESETFWSNIDALLEDGVEDITEDEFLAKYPFLTEEDKNVLREDFRNAKENVE
jgi:hypothetical protein